MAWPSSQSGQNFNIRQCAGLTGSPGKSQTEVQEDHGRVQELRARPPGLPSGSSLSSSRSSTLPYASVWAGWISLVGIEKRKSALLSDPAPAAHGPSAFQGQGDSRGQPGRARALAKTVAKEGSGPWPRRARALAETPWPRRPSRA